MIEIVDKVECCGCQVCGDVCPKAAITFQTDHEGIWYPVVDKAKCVDCRLCDKICPVINRTSCPTNYSEPESYVLQAPNSTDRLLSASGAAYTLLAQSIYEQGGIIAGHIWDDQFGVRGYISTSVADFDKLRGTKYLQSDVTGIYTAVRQIVKDGKLVLFSGTPCQNAAMRSFLRKDYDNLIMTDFVCMGIDSPLAFKKYIESLESQFDSKIVYFKAKSKEVGWRHLTNKTIFENGKTYFGINGRDANLNATFLNVLVRPSCYDCKFKGFPRVSDITIGDYWRRKSDYDSLDDNTGTSYVMLHNQKATSLFEKIKPICHYRQVEFKEILAANKFAVMSLPKPKLNRDEFYRRLHQEDFSALVYDFSTRKSTSPSFLHKVKKATKIILSSICYYRCHPMSLLRFYYYNVFSSKVKANLLAGDIFIFRNTEVHLGKTASIEVRGCCIIDGLHQKSLVHVGNGGTLSFDHNTIGAGTTISVKDNASVSIGYMTLVESGVTIYARTGISIGEFSLIDDNVRIDDTNQGILYFNEINSTDRQIRIGTHVLLNKGSIVKGTTTLNDETIISEYAVVNGVFPPRTILAGNPAKEINKNINWKHNFENKWKYRS